MHRTTSLYRIVSISFVLLVFALAACSNPAAPTGNASSSTPTPTQQQANTNPVNTVPSPTPTHPLNKPVVATPVTTPASGPIIIETPTPVAGGNPHSQLVSLPDRTLTIQSVSEQQGSDANSTDVSLVMTLANTGAKVIPNQATYYQLVGAEGDIFGLQSSATASFYGTIASHGSRTGTIVFQVPSAAIKGLRLLFPSEIATATVFVH